ncbi:hypothetical protein AB6N24_09870 [Cellulomonas sp. 179-A 4D5 NHS]|uniref:hypothetical protein n=1 Tax=Cellulomonas sp. 179-A 4D5 NHS TaxID=3142378 RepID=UPI00399FCF43
MSILAHTQPTEPAIVRRGSARATRAPYLVGDHVQALDGFPGGTRLLLAGRVVGVEPRDPERADYPWRVTYEVEPGRTRAVWVNARGVDLHQYVAPSVTTLTLHEQDTPDGRFALTLARLLRRAGVAGPLARRSPAGAVTVVVFWPSGRERVVAHVAAARDSARFQVAAYPDVAGAAPVAREGAWSVIQAQAVILRLLR